MKSIYQIYLTSLVLILYTLDVCAQNPNWHSPNASNYAYSATIISTIHLDNVPSNDANDTIAIIDNGQIQGLGKSINLGNGQYLHFITIYANQPIDTFSIAIYHNASNAVHQVFENFAFSPYRILGSVDNPYVFDIFTNDIPSISFNDIDNQITIEGLAFTPIALFPYLQTYGFEPISYSFIPNNQLIVSLQNDTLFTSGANGFVGTTELNVSATFMVNGNFITSNRNISFTVTPIIASPLWSPSIPNQGILLGNEFDSVALHTYENQYAGDSILYDYIPVIEEGSNFTAPLWSIHKRYSHNMTVIARLNYTPKYQFADDQDVLAAFVGSEVRGVAHRNQNNGLYYLTIGSNQTTNETISFRLYSRAMKSILTLDSVLSYIPYQSLGDDIHPFEVEFAPIVPIVSNHPVASGIYTMPVTILDTTFVGSVTFTFMAKDPNYPNYLKDEVNATFCIVEDSSQLITFYEDLDQDGFGNPFVYTLACAVPDGYVSNGNDCNDADPNSEVVTTSVLEFSGVPDDGFVCKNVVSTIQVNTNALSYLWSTGETLSSIKVSPSSTSVYTVTVTLFPGCIQVVADTIFVEGKVIKDGSNDGFNTLRNIIFCAAEGDTLTYDFNFTSRSDLTSILQINKNLTILGSPQQTPVIGLTFHPNSNGIAVGPDYILHLQDVNIQLMDWVSQSVFSGKGEIDIKGLVRIFD